MFCPKYLSSVLVQTVFVFIFGFIQYVRFAWSLLYHMQLKYLINPWEHMLRLLIYAVLFTGWKISNRHEIDDRGAMA